MSMKLYESIENTIRSRRVIMKAMSWLLCSLILTALFNPTSSLYAQYENNPSLPKIPSIDDSLSITLIYPEPEMTRPPVKRNFVFGSVGSGKATLTINGADVAVAPNGAFLTFMSNPKKGYTLIAQKDGLRDTLRYDYEKESAPTRPKRVRKKYTKPKLGIITEGNDTLGTGSSIAYGAPTQWADREWFFPRETKLRVYERRDGHYRVDLAGTKAWVEAQYISLSDESPPQSAKIDQVVVEEKPEYTDLRFPVNFAPFKIRLGRYDVKLTLYGVSVAKEGVSGKIGGDLLKGYSLSRGKKNGVATASVGLSRSLWGIKAFYDEEGNLVLRVRKSPELNPANPLEGLTVMVDAGHPPRGATGPTGLTEADANLFIALALEESLKKRGANVVMTRRDSNALVSQTNVSEELSARVDLAVQSNADLLISVHNNGFANGVNPYEKNGTETYYFHDFAADLAGAVQKELVQVTGVPSLGHKRRSLALTRPTWMPAILTESLYMMHPQQEVALRDSAFVTKLGEAHIRGIENFLRRRMR